MLKIEAGKFYRDGYGNKVGPMVMRDATGGSKYPWQGFSEFDKLSHKYTVDGRYLIHSPHHFRNLVAEDTDASIERGATASETNAIDPDHIADLVYGFKPEPPNADAIVKPGYESLAGILGEALEQASRGKGNQRHARGEAFHHQPIMEIARRRGIGFQLGQVDKKTLEAQGMLERGETDAAVREFLGAINYLAAAIMTARESA